jgi:hypothetical protein
MCVGVHAKLRYHPVDALLPSCNQLQFGDHACRPQASAADHKRGSRNIPQDMKEAVTATWHVTHTAQHRAAEGSKAKLTLSSE